MSEDEIIVIDVPNDSLKDPWEKQDDETSKSFSAFKVYRDLPPHKRSLAKAVKELYGDGATVSKLRQFQTWSAKYGWVWRANAWDENIDKTEIVEKMEAVKEMRKRHTMYAKIIQQKAIERLKQFDAAELTPQLLLHYIQSGTTLERLTLGEPSEINVNKSMNLNVDIDYTEKTDDEIRELLAKRTSE